MRLNAEQLRKIIVEELRRSRLAEAEGTVGRDVLDDAQRTLLDAAEAAWKGSYDESDPSMAAGERDAWNEQCEAALEDLAGGLRELITSTEDTLFEGRYA